MGDAQSAQRDGTSEAAAEEQSAVQDGPSGDSTHEKLIQNNGQISDINGKSGGTIPEVDHCEDKANKEAITVKDKVTSITKTKPEEIPNVQIIQGKLPDANEEETIEIINVDTKQNDLNESFRKFFSNIGLKLTVNRGVAEKTDILEETASETKYEDVEQNTDLNAIQDNDSTTCPTLTDETPESKVEATKEMTETKEMVEKTQDAFVEDVDNQNKDAMLDEYKHEGEEFVSPFKKFFTTGIFASISKKKKEEEAVDKESVDIGKNDTAEEQHEIGKAIPSTAEQEEIECKAVHSEQVQVTQATEQVQVTQATEEDIRAKSPSTDQESDSEITSSQEKAQSSPFKRLFSGTSFKRLKKRQKRRKSGDIKMSDSGELSETKIVTQSPEKTEQDRTEEALSAPPPSAPSPSPPPPSSPTPPAPPETPLPSTTEPEEELSAWEAFKKLMTPKKSFKRTSEETQVPAAEEETKLNEGEQVSDQSADEGRKRKDSSHSWEAVLCGSGRRRSRKTSDSEDEQKESSGQVESPNETRDAVTSTPKQAGSPSDGESSAWKSFKKLMTPKRKLKEDEESKEIAQSDSEGTQDETLFSLRKLLPGRKKKQDQFSSDEGDREAVSVDEDSETPAVVPLSEFDQSETETAKTTTETEESKIESEKEHILEIPKTFVQEVQEHQVTPIIALNPDQDELTEFSKYQPLSDIPEEGNITETVATSFIGEVVKDDTIAEDMVEITSEAITAHEPVDITMADETDELMLSAASHLPESSKTSGNATPVLPEYDIKDTDVLLKEAVEMISTAADVVCSEEPSLGRVLGSVTDKTLEKNLNVIEIHTQSEAVTIETGLHVDQLQDVDVEIPATVLSESVSEFKDAISTEYVSAVSKVEFQSAKADIDEVHSVHSEQPVKQESIDDSEYMIESLSEVPESTEILLQDEDQDVGQDVLPAECLEGETEEMRTEITELVLENAEAGCLEEETKAITTETIEPFDHAEPSENDESVPLEEKTEKEEIVISSEPELQNAEMDSILKICKEKEGLSEDEDMVVSNAQIDEPAECIQPESDQILTTQVLVLEGTDDLDQEVSQGILNAQTLEQFQEETETSVDAESVMEGDFAYKQDIEGAQDHALETSNLPVLDFAVQETQCIPVSGLEIKEAIIEDSNNEQAEEDTIGENNHNISEEPIDETDNKEEVSVNEPTPEQEGKDLPVTEVQQVAISEVVVATNKLLEETIEDEDLEGKVPLVDEEIMMQNTEEVAVQGKNDEFQEQTPPEVAEGKIDAKIEAQETTEHHDQEMLSKVTDVQNGQESLAKECKVVFKSNDALERNGVHNEDEQSAAQVLQVDHSHEVTDDLEALLLPAVIVSAINENSDIAQVLEDTVQQEKSSELSEDEQSTAQDLQVDNSHKVTDGQETLLLPAVLVSTINENSDIAQVLEDTVELEKSSELFEDEQSTAQVLQVDHSQEVTDNLEALMLPDVLVSTINEDSDIAQVLEDTVELEESSELFASTTEEQIQEMCIGETEVNVEGQQEEYIPCPITEQANAEHAALPEENIAASQQITHIVPALMIHKTTEDSERLSEETSTLYVDNALFQDEPKHEVQLTEVQEVGIQGEKDEEIVPPVTSNAHVQYALITETTTCSVHDTGLRIPHVSLETTTPMHEPTLGIYASEQENNESVETTTPLEVNDATQVAQEVKTVVIQHVPLKSDDKHNIEVQVVDVDIECAESRVDTTLEIIVQEDKEVVDTCHETEKVESISAITKTEQEVDNEQDNVSIHEVVHHIKEISPESEEQKQKEPPNDLIGDKISDDQTINETQNEENNVEVKQGSEITTKDEVLTKMSEVKDVHKEPSVETQVATSNNTAVAVNQNTGIVSAIGNVETPSSLSLEFKLNIQFGQSKAPILPSYPTASESTLSSSPTPQSSTVPPVDRNEPSKPPDMTEVGVQVNEEPKQENEQQTSNIKTETAVEAVETTEETSFVETVKQVLGFKSKKTEEPIDKKQATEMTQSKPILLDVGTQSADIADQIEEKTEEVETMVNQPILIDAGMQSTQHEDLSEKDQMTEVMSLITNTDETDEPNKELITKEVILTDLAELRVSEDPIKPTEEEDENQDIWMDAEEDIKGQDEITMSICEIEESFESQPDYFQETKSDFEESFDDKKKTTPKCDSEEEDFAAALEDPQITTAIVNTEWD